MWSACARIWRTSGCLCIWGPTPPRVLSLTTVLVSTTGYVGDLLYSRVCWRLLPSFTAVPLVLGSRAEQKEEDTCLRIRLSTTCDLSATSLTEHVFLAVVFLFVKQLNLFILNEKLWTDLGFPFFDGRGWTPQLRRENGGGCRRPRKEPSDTWWHYCLPYLFVTLFAVWPALLTTAISLD